MSVRAKLISLRSRILSRARLWNINGNLVRTLYKRIRGIFDLGDDGGSDCSDFDDIARFAPVLESLKLDAVPGFACRIRQGMSAGDSVNRLQQTTEECCVSTCKVDLQPMYGSYNILFPIQFGDGLKWILKIPAAGVSERWDQSAARALESEALTMRMLRQKTSMPIPTVHAFDASLENELGCPFILMDFIEGRPLYERWSSQTASDDPEVLETFRSRVLETLASSMVQLTSFSFQQSGSLSYNRDGDVQSLGPARAYDAPAVWKNMFEDRPGIDVPFFDVAPFDNAQKLLLYFFSRHEPKTDPFGRGLDEMFRLFISWIPEDHIEAPFVLAHPDYDLQNVLVKEDGTVCGLIDWDGVAAVPRSFGCESFPRWLTRDWDPFFYSFVNAREKAGDCDKQNNNSPETLAYYRIMYAQFMNKFLSVRQDNSTITNCTKHHGPAFTEHSNTNRKSLLIGSLAAAAMEPLSTAEIIFGIYDRITHITMNRSIQSSLDGPCVGLINDEPLNEANEEASSPASETNAILEHIDEDDSSGMHDLQEMAWVLDYPTAEEESKLETGPLPTLEIQPEAVPRIDTGFMTASTEKSIYHQQDHVGATKEQLLVSVTCLGRKTSWTKQTWGKIGSLAFKVSGPLRSSLRSRSLSPSSAQPTHRSNGPAAAPRLDDCKRFYSPSSQPSSEQNSLSSTPNGTSTEITKSTDLSDQQSSISTTHRSSTTRPSTSSPPPQEPKAPTTRCDFPHEISQPESNSTISKIPSRKDMMNPPPSQTSNPTNSNPTKSKKALKGPCRLARHLLNKLPCRRPKSKQNPTPSIHPCPNAPPEEPPAHPIGPSTHQQRMTAIRRAAAQKSPTDIHVSREHSPESLVKVEGVEEVRPVEEEMYVQEGFSSYEVALALADGTLDEARMRRLRDGFLMLYDSL